MKNSIILLSISVILMIDSCKNKNSKQTIDLKNIYAWCIVPFDSANRSSKERITMLKELGIIKYAYDWRKKDLSNMAAELTLAKQNDIEVIAVWMWIDDTRDSPNSLSEANEKVFNIIEEVGFEGQIWIGFNANFFENLSDSLAVKKGADIIGYLSNRAKSLNCKVALYNHGDWFGEPINQIKIIKELPKNDLGIVYNFHHAHQQIDSFPKMVDAMLPYLWSVNLSGLRKEGPKILPLGKGDHEMKMIQILKQKGYHGDFGILGHVEDADVETILRANLNGLKLLNSHL